MDPAMFGDSASMPAMPAPMPAMPEEPAPEPARKKKLPLKKDEFQRWCGEIKRCERRVDGVIEGWKRNVRAFAGQPPSNLPDGTTWINKDYPRVKGKLSQLFFRVPEVQAIPRHVQFAPAAPLVAAATNQVLMREMRVASVVDEVLTDILSAAGVGAVVVGYHAVTETVETPVEDLSMAPAVVSEGMVASGMVPTQKVEVPIHEEYYCDRISPADLLYPASFRSSDWDRAPWLGYRFEMPVEEARRRYKLPKEFAGKRPNRQRLLYDDLTSDVDTDEVVVGYVIWYRAYLYDRKVKHPQHLRRLVIVDGVEDGPVVHEDSPYQRWDGKKWLGMTWFPVRPLTLTYVPDTSSAPSDAQITRPQVDELIRSRTLMMAQKERSLPLRWYDMHQVDEEAAEVLRTGWLQSWLPLNGPGERILGEVARANYPRENFEFDNVISRDLDEAWSMSPNQVGSDTVGETTATEAKAMQTAVSTRLDYERNKVLRWFVSVADSALALIQLFHDDEAWVEVIGQDGLRRMQAWDRAKVQGEFAFEIRPDGALRIDAQQERVDARNLYQFLRQDPMVESTRLLESVIRTHNLDPGTLIKQKPPEKAPDSPNISYRFSGDDLNPINPAFPIIVSILNTAGIQIDPKIIQAAHANAQRMVAGMAQSPVAPGQPLPSQTEHGGLAPQQPALSKHHAERGTTV